MKKLFKKTFQLLSNNTVKTDSFFTSPYTGKPAILIKNDIWFELFFKTQRFKRTSILFFLRRQMLLVVFTLKHKTYAQLWVWPSSISVLRFTLCRATNLKVVFQLLSIQKGLMALEWFKLLNIDDKWLIKVVTHRLCTWSLGDTPQMPFPEKNWRSQQFFLWSLQSCSSACDATDDIFLINTQDFDIFISFFLSFLFVGESLHKAFLVLEAQEWPQLQNVDAKS